MKTTGEKMDDLCALIGERFDDYVLIVRDGPKSISWRSSDPTWAMGATQRYADGVKQSDRLTQSEHFWRE